MSTVRDNTPSRESEIRELVLAFQKGYFLNEASEERRQALLFEDVGLTYNMFRILRFLYMHSDENIEPSELSEVLYILRPTMTNTLNHLEKTGYIRRDIHPTDRRRIIVNLLPLGEEVLRKALIISRDYHDRVFSHFTSEELEQYISMRNRMAQIRDKAVEDILAERQKNRYS